MELKDQIAVMQAFADGKEVEWRYRGKLTWKTARLPYSKLGWNWEEYEYRVKRTPISIDVVVYQYDRGPVRVCSEHMYPKAGSESWRYHKLHETTIILPDHIELLK